MANVTITPAHVQAMFLNITKGYPFNECRQPDTFAVIDSQDAFEADNLGLTYQDYLDGTFWSRNWVQQGADANTLCKKYPIVSIEIKTAYLKDVCRNEYCFKAWLVIADVPDCGNCKDNCKRTVAELDKDLMITMQTFLKEMLRYVYVICVIEGAGNPDVVGWFTPEEAAQIQIDNVCLTFQACHDLCTVLTDQGRVDINIADLANSDNARAVVASLTFCGCNEVETDNFDYTLSEPPEISNTDCDGC